MASVQRDVPSDRRSEMFRAQFSKAYYNIGMIYDKMGKTKEASDSYRKSLNKCEEDPQKKLTQSATYKKAGTNYAVTLEKLGEREEAVKML
jgi:tetratricopeptide (TPR) repeat protein